MSNFVAEYRRLDDNAARHENQAEQYRQRADHDRWEQCRIAHEAVESGEFNQTSFGKAVGKHATTVGRQVRLWSRWGSAASADRPAYGEAMSAEAGTVPMAERRGATITGTVRSLPADERARLASELLSDEDVADEVMSNPTTRMAATSAAERARNWTPPEDRPQSRNVLTGMANEMKVGALIDDARRKLREAGELAKDEDFDADAIELFEGQLTKLGVAVDFLRAAIHGDSFDTELEKLLRSET